MSLDRPQELEAELIDEGGVAPGLLEHRVDQHRLARARVREKIRVCRRLRVEQLSEDHVDNFTPVSALVGGAALTALSNLSAQTFVFVAAMIAGGVFARMISRAAPGA
jgi:hypothetical protein